MNIQPQDDFTQASNQEVVMFSRATSVFYGDLQAVKDVSLALTRGEVLALIGPSGCGKSSYLKTFNRMVEHVPNARVEGTIMLDGQDIQDMDVVELRAQVGMVFQKPNPFPKTIFENVAYGPRIHGLFKNKADLDEIVETNLVKAGLWNEVKDRLHESGTSLSGGQQQRLCIARALATSPSVLLMDEPCSALDPIATGVVEDTIQELKEHTPIILVTHEMHQANRVSDYTAFFDVGGVLDNYQPSKEFFTNPATARAQAYISGNFG